VWYKASFVKNKVVAILNEDQRQATAKELVQYAQLQLIQIQQFHSAVIEQIYQGLECGIS
jgi:hypothetical protein